MNTSGNGNCFACGKRGHIAKYCRTIQHNDNLNLNMHQGNIMSETNNFPGSTNNVQQPQHSMLNAFERFSIKDDFGLLTTDVNLPSCSDWFIDSGATQVT